MSADAESESADSTRPSRTPAAPAGGSCTPRSARRSGGSPAASAPASCGPLAKLTVPLLAAAAVDDGMRKGDGGKVAHADARDGRWSASCRRSRTGLRRYAAFRIALRTETDLRQRLFAHLQRLHFAFHDQSQTGQLMARANTDIQQVETAVILIPLTAASCLTMVGVLVIMVLKSPVLALLGLGALPFLNIAATRFSNRIAPVNLALQQELADLSGVVEESLAGVRVVKGFGAERMQVKRLEAEAEQRARPGARRRRSCAPASSRSSTSCRRSRWSRSSGTAATRCSRATCRSATSSPSTSTSSC